MPRTITRADDERLLKMIALRCQGLTAEAIAQRFGLTRGGVLAVTRQVLIDDLACSGEAPARVRAAYWPERGA